MDSLFSANIIGTIGEFLVNFPVVSAFAMVIVFFLRGEVATLFAVYLIQQGYLGWTKFLLIGFLSIMLQDLIWYYLGKYGEKTRFSSYLENKFSTAKTLKRYLKDNTAKALILTKFTIGLGSITILLSGWSKISFKRFLKINAIADALWLGVMTALSFILIQVLGFFGARDAFNSIGYVLAGLVVLIFGFEWLAQKYFTESTGIDEKEIS